MLDSHTYCKHTLQLPFMFGLNMNCQMTLSCSLIVTTIFHFTPSCLDLVWYHKTGGLLNTRSQCTILTLKRCIPRYNLCPSYSCVVLLAVICLVCAWGSTVNTYTIFMCSMCRSSSNIHVLISIIILIISFQYLLKLRNKNISRTQTGSQCLLALNP